MIQSLWYTWAKQLLLKDWMTRRGRQARAGSRRLTLERLEERTVPTAVSVQTGLSGAQGTTVTVPILVDTLNDTANNNSGLSAATLALQYDPAVFTESSADVSVGSLLPADWKATSTVDQTNGTIVINLAGSVDTATVGGTLANINFNINSTATPGSTTINLMQNIGSASTTLDDQNGNPYTLNPAPTNAGDDPVDATLTVTHVNQAPTITAPASASTNENTNLTFSGNDSISVNDVDANGNSEQLSLAVNHGTLTLSNINGLVFDSGLNGSASFTVTGTLTDLNTDLQSLAYEPATSFFGSDTLNIGMNDLGNTGTGGPQTASDTVALTVTEVNQPPTITAPAQLVTSENSSGTFANNQISVNDVDSNGAAEQLSLAVNDGTLMLASTNGLTFNSGANGSASLTVTGTLADLNAALNGLTYTPATNFFGSDTLNIGMNDLGNTGTGGPQTASDTVALTVNQVATHFVISAPASATAGTSFTFTVTAEAANNNPVTSFDDTVQITSSDGKAVLPPNAVLTNGTGTFTITLDTAGNDTITATDTTSSVTGNDTVAVSAAAASQLVVNTPSSTTAGSPVSFTVTAEDPFGNTATDFSDTVHFTSSDSKATLPADSTLTNGVGSFSATFDTAGNQTLTATDSTTSSITAGSDTIAVSAGAATQFVVSAPSSAKVGTAITVTVTAEDQFDNTATSYTGTVHFTSSDTAATLPADTTLTNGVGSVSVTFNTAGTQTVTATDTVTSSITGTSGSVTVSMTTNYTAAIFDPTTGIWTVDTQGTGDPSSSDETFTFGLPGDTAIIGDWNGAGFDEIGVYRVDTALTDPVTGLHPLIFSLNVSGTGTYNPSAGDVSFIFGLQGDTVVIGDWNGDGKDEIGVVRPGSDGVLVWSLNLSTGDPTDIAVDNFGLNGDEPIVGIWAGNGKTEIGTVRTVGGALVWSLDTNGDGSFDAGDAVFNFGQAGDIPILGNWSGGSSTEIGTYRVDPNGAELDFSLDLSGTGVFTAPPDVVDTFGAAGDTAIVGDWNGSGTTKIGTYRLSTVTQDLLFSFDTNGDGTFDTGDVASQVGIPGGPTPQVYIGQWQSNLS
jgi:Bacterial Ig domain